MDENDEAVREGYLPAIRDLFLRARDRLKGRDDVEKVRYGIKKFKRKLLGVCGSEGTMSIDDVAEVLTDIGVAQSLGEAKEKVGLFEKGALFYGEYKCLLVKRINEGLYKISTHVASREDITLLVGR